MSNGSWAGTYFPDLAFRAISETRQGLRIADLGQALAASDRTPSRRETGAPHPDCFAIVETTNDRSSTLRSGANSGSSEVEDLRQSHSGRDFYRLEIRRLPRTRFRSVALASGPTQLANASMRRGESGWEGNCPGLSMRATMSGTASRAPRYPRCR